mgnify:CR=1 FL=1
MKWLLALSRADLVLERCGHNTVRRNSAGAA